MLRTLDLLAIALGIAATGLLFTPAAAYSGASSHMVPFQIPAGELPRPQLVPKVRQPYCATHNCIVPPRNLGDH
jgi:hypothetical protein